MARQFIAFITNNEGHTEEQPLPTKKIKCPSCQGKGKSSAYLGAYTRSEFDEAFDEEGKADYFAGRYDRPCNKCEGAGKQTVVDLKRCTHAQRTSWQEQLDWEYESESERRMERRMMGELD
jgi:DnaJ-class molecular chaperone